MTDAAPALSPADALAQLAFAVEGLLVRHASKHDMSLTQLRLLGVLRDRVPTMNELGRLLELDKSSISGLVDRAERRGLVARAPSTTDRRAVTVRLTAAGDRLASQVSAAYAAEAEGLLALLPAADRDALIGLIGRLLVAQADARGIDLFATGASLRA